MDKVSELFNTLDGRVRYELETQVEIKECSEFPDVNSLSLEKRRWALIEDVVAVVVDLKGSTQLEFSGRRAQSSARLYEAVTSSCVRIAKSLESRFIDIRGDVERQEGKEARGEYYTRLEEGEEA